jgi:ADP-ribose pyrophosphatase YjhB (NUDIX family)
MSYRAAVILLQDGKIALIERHRSGLHYFTIPGGHIDPGETPEAAAMREAQEELGVQVTIRRLVVVAEWQGHDYPQYYFLADIVDGTFGTGTGEEMVQPRPERGTYHPLWMPIPEMLDQPVKPAFMAELVNRYWESGWPDEPVRVSE